MRNTRIVRIIDEGRDKGKIFILKEPPASVIERWATRALFAMGRAGIELPDNAAGAGMAALVSMGFQALLRANVDEIQPLLDEMWQCVTIQPDQRHPEIIRQLMWSGSDGEGADIEEITTMFKLRMEVVELITGFSSSGADSTSSTSSTISTPADLSNTRTSMPPTAAPLRRSSPPGKRR